MSPAISSRWARTDAEPMRTAHPLVDPHGVEQVETSLRTVHHRLGDGAVQRDRRAGRHPLEQPVERHDLRPIGLGRRRRLVVECGDRRLQLVAAESSGGERMP